MRRRMAFLAVAPVLLATLLVGAGPALAQDTPYPGTTTVTTVVVTTAPVTLAPQPSAATPTAPATHGGLAFTGLDIVALVAVALVLLAVGTALLMWRRRRDVAHLGTA